MRRCFEKRLLSSGGFTLVEIVIVMAISAIVFTGMLVTYTEGVQYMRYNSSMMTLYNEGTAALKRITREIRESGRARIRPSGGVSDARLELSYNEFLDGGSVDFWFSSIDNKMKWNNRRWGKSKLNMRLLPMTDFETEPGEEPYLRVKDLRFTPLDHIGPSSPYLEGYFLIKIEMVLENDQGDTLYLSSVASKRNTY